MRPDLPYCLEHKTFFWRERSIVDHREYARCTATLTTKRYDVDVTPEYVEAMRKRP